MAELVAIGYPEEAKACHARDEVNQLITTPDAARAIIQNSLGSIRVATNPYALAVGIIWGMFLGLLVGPDRRHGLGSGRRCRARGPRRQDRQDRDRPGVPGPRPGMLKPGASMLVVMVNKGAWDKVAVARRPSGRRFGRPSRGSSRQS